MAERFKENDFKTVMSSMCDKNQKKIRMKDYLDNIRRLPHKNFTQFFLANVIFSVSTFIVNVCLPKLFERSFFDTFIYIFQMVLFFTTIMQAGLSTSLYYFIKRQQKESLNVYYTAILAVNLILLLLGLVNGNIVSSLLKLGSLSLTEHLMFYLSVMASGIYMFNKGKNVADKAYKYMMRISITAFSIRMLVLVSLYFFHVKSLALALFLIFILPYAQDLHDYVVNTARYVKPRKFDRSLCKKFLSYSFKVWLTGCLFMVSDKIFLIYNKETDIQFTTAIAFSAGFMGIISLFNASFSNYFLSRLNSDRMEEIRNYIRRLRKMMPLYLTLLIVVCTVFSAFVYVCYSSLGTVTAIVTFIILLRAGVFFYFGMLAMLSKVLNLLNIEVVLNVCRVIVIYCLCVFWYPQSLLLWYTVVMYSVLFPEVIMSFIVTYRVGRNIKQTKQL